MYFPPPRILYDSAIPFFEGLLAPHAELIARTGSAITASDLQGVDALVVRTRTRCDEALLGASPVRLVVTATIGHDHIDRAWCERQGIRVVTAAGCNARGVLQWVAALLAKIARKEGFRPHERTLGIVGVGHVGSLVKAYAEAWGFRVLCCDPPREEREKLGFLPLEAVAEEADILTFHTPLDATTFHLCDTALLARMKPSAWIVNAARGAVVDQEALLAADHPFALDVWEEEPHLNRELLQRAEVATPHIAGYTIQGKANATAIAAQAIAAHFGLPITACYPADIPHPTPRPISWEALAESINDYCDLDAESRILKEAPERFEQLRDGYRYRLEYF